MAEETISAAVKGCGLEQKNESQTDGLLLGKDEVSFKMYGLVAPLYVSFYNKFTTFSWVLHEYIYKYFKLFRGCSYMDSDDAYKIGARFRSR